MAQLLDPLPSEDSDRIICNYVNTSSKIQVVRITNIANWYFERVVFPGQRLMFEAMPEAQLEIHTGMMASSILSDRIPCDRLIVEEESVFKSFNPANEQSIEQENESVSVVASSASPALTSIE